MTLSVPKTSFVGGEWTPDLHNRTALAKYPTAVKRMENTFCSAFGSASNRPGFKFVSEVKDSNSIVKLYPFEFSVIQTYVLEFSDQCMRVVRDGGIVSHNARIEDISLVNSTYKWTLSGSGTSEYYLEDIDGGDPVIREAKYLFENGSSISKGTLGSLSAGEWSYGDNDSLDYDTFYVRLTDNTDPDSKADDFIEANYHTATSLVDSTLQWTASGSGTNEYYVELNGGGDPSLSLPNFIFEDGSSLTKGTLGSLAVGEWNYGDNDSLGYSTIYVRLTDNTDPDTKEVGFVEASYNFELTLPYQDTDLDLVKINQSADTLYLTHPDYPPQKILRYAHDDWEIESIVFGTDIGAPQNLTASGGTTAHYKVTAVRFDGQESLPSARVLSGGASSLDWDDVPGAEYYNVYKDDSDDDTYGFIAQSQKSSYSLVTGGIVPDYTLTPPRANNPFNSAGNYPGVSVFFEQRLIFLRTDNDPQTIWGSVSGDFQNQNVSFPLKDDDAYKFTINALKVNEIRWAVPLEDLVIGTSGSEWKMNSGGGSDAVTPTSVSLKRQSGWGVSHVQPIVIGSTILFVDGSKKKIRDLLFSLEVDGYAGNDLSILASHLFKDNEITEWCYDPHPESIIWAVRDDGKLLGMTYLKEQQIWGWHIHDTDGVFESVTCIQTGAGKSELYAVVRREINGSFKRYIEVLTERMPVGADFSVDVQDAFFVDSGLSLDVPISIESLSKTDPVVVGATGHGLSNGDLIDFATIVGFKESSDDDAESLLNGNRYKVKNATANDFEITDEQDNDIDGTGATDYISTGVVRKAVTNISGLSHLEGKEVSVLANGSYVKGLTVSSGAITLPNAASRVHIGLPYTSYLETLEFEFQGPEGTIQDKEREVKSVQLGLGNTRSLEVGPSDDEDKLIEIAFRTDEDYGKPTRLFNGDLEKTIEAGDSESTKILFRNKLPLPFTIRKVVSRVDFGDN